MKHTDEIVKTAQSHIGEGIHTSLRKFCESKESTLIHSLIDKMPDDEWNMITEIVAKEVVKTTLQTHNQEIKRVVEEHRKNLDKSNVIDVAIDLTLEDILSALDK